MHIKLNHTSYPFSLWYYMPNYIHDSSSAVCDFTKQLVLHLNATCGGVVHVAAKSVMFPYYNYLILSL